MSIHHAHRGRTTFVIALLLVAFLAAADSSQTPTPSLRTFVFRSDGTLVGQPPTKVLPYDFIDFSIAADSEITETQVTDAVTVLTKAIGGINVTLEKRTNPEFLLLGITEARLREVRAAYCSMALDLLTALPPGPGTDGLVEGLQEVACPDPNAPAAAAPSVEVPLPPFAFGADSYTVNAKCLVAAQDSLRIDPAPGLPREFVTRRLQAPDCAEVAYELRQVKAVAGAVDALANANGKMPDALRAALAASRKEYQDNRKKKSSAVLEKHKTLVDCLTKADVDSTKIIQCSGSADQNSAWEKLKKAEAELTEEFDHIKTLFDPIIAAQSAAFAERWLWLSSGRPTLHPRSRDTTKATSDEIDALKATLVRLDAQIATLDKLTGAGIKIDDASKLVEAVEKLSEMREKREITAAEIAKKTKEVAAAEQTRLGDTFLYDGRMLIGTDVVMQHHDAMNQYVIMGKPVSYVTDELERVAVLSENESPTAELKLIQTVTPITNDRSLFVEELQLSLPAADAPGNLAGLTPEMRLAAFVDLSAEIKRLYELLQGAVAFADAELTTPPAVLRFLPDPTPARVTKVIPHNLPGPAPAQVAYSITRKEGTEDKPVGSGSYRLNRLYRVRFKTGLMYSTFESNNVTVTPADGDDTVTNEIEKHGVDMVFGVQTYLGARRDPRTISPASPGWSLLTALTAKNPTENLLVGIGYEPWGGVTLNLGGHVGRSERHSSDPEQPAIEDEWKVRPFFGITFDVDFLKQLFTIKPQF